MPIIVHQEKCRGCSLCVKNCPFDAMVMSDKLPVIGDSCTECGVCLEKCAFGALEKKETVKKEQFLKNYI